MSATAEAERGLDVRKWHPSPADNVGDRSFFTAGARLCNSLPEDVHGPVCLVTDISAKSGITFI